MIYRHSTSQLLILIYYCPELKIKLNIIFLTQQTYPRQNRIACHNQITFLAILITTKCLQTALKIDCCQKKQCLLLLTFPLLFNIAICACKQSAKWESKKRSLQMGKINKYRKERKEKKWLFLQQRHLPEIPHLLFFHYDLSPCIMSAYWLLWPALKLQFNDFM